MRVIFRHWLIITLGLIITGMGTTYAYLNIPNAYSSTSVVMLLQKPTTATKVGENPYLSMDASLTVTASAVQRAVSDSPTMASALDTPSSRGTFLITPVMSGPFLQIDAEAASKANTLMIQQIVREEMRKTLTTLQSSVGAPSSLQIQLNEVTQPSKAKPVLKRKLQFVGGILFGGLGLTTSVAFLAERIRSSRQTRRTATGLVSEEPGTESPAPVTTPDPPVVAVSVPPKVSGGVPAKIPDKPTKIPVEPAKLPSRPQIARVPPSEVPPELRLRPIGAVSTPPGRTGWRAPVQRQTVKTRNGVNGFPTPPESPLRAWNATQHLLRVPTDPDRG